MQQSPYQPLVAQKGRGGIFRADITPEQRRLLWNYTKFRLAMWGGHTVILATSITVEAIDLKLKDNPPQNPQDGLKYEGRITHLMLQFNWIDQTVELVQLGRLWRKIKIDFADLRKFQRFQQPFRNIEFLLSAYVLLLYLGVDRSGLDSFLRMHGISGAFLGTAFQLMQHFLPPLLLGYDIVRNRMPFYTQPAVFGSIMALALLWGAITTAYFKAGNTDENGQTNFYDMVDVVKNIALAWGLIGGATVITLPLNKGVEKVLDRCRRGTRFAVDEEKNPLGIGHAFNRARLLTSMPPASDSPAAAASYQAGPSDSLQPSATDLDIERQMNADKPDEEENEAPQNNCWSRLVSCCLRRW